MPREFILFVVLSVFLSAALSLLVALWSLPVLANQACIPGVPFTAEICDEYDNNCNNLFNEDLTYVSGTLQSSRACASGGGLYYVLNRTIPAEVPPHWFIERDQNDQCRIINVPQTNQHALRFDLRNDRNGWCAYGDIDELWNMNMSGGTASQGYGIPPLGGCNGNNCPNYIDFRYQEVHYPISANKQYNWYRYEKTDDFGTHQYFRFGPNVAHDASCDYFVDIQEHYDVRGRFTAEQFRLSQMSVIARPNVGSADQRRHYMLTMRGDGSLGVCSPREGDWYAMTYGITHFRGQSATDVNTVFTTEFAIDMERNAQTSQGMFFISVGPVSQPWGNYFSAGTNSGGNGNVILVDGGDQFNMGAFERATHIMISSETATGVSRPSGFVRINITNGMLRAQYRPTAQASWEELGSWPLPAKQAPQEVYMLSFGYRYRAAQGVACGNTFKTITTRIYDTQASGVLREDCARGVSPGSSWSLQETTPAQVSFNSNLCLLELTSPQGFRYKLTSGLSVFNNQTIDGQTVPSCVFVDGQDGRNGVYTDTNLNWNLSRPAHYFAPSQYGELILCTWEKTVLPRPAANVCIDRFLFGTPYVPDTTDGSFLSCGTHNVLPYVMQSSDGTMYPAPTNAPPNTRIDVLSYTAAVDGSACHVVGDYMCSPATSQWRTGVDTVYQGSGQSLMHVKNFTKYSTSPVSSPGNAASCCPQGHCWNGVAGACVSGTQYSPFGVLDGRYRCDAGIWTTAGIKYSPLRNEIGYCQQQSQCFWSFSGNPSVCVDDGQKVGPYYCNSGSWTSMSNILGNKMRQSFLDRNSGVGNPRANEYSLFCGTIQETLNYIGEIEDASGTSQMSRMLGLSGISSYACDISQTATVETCAYRACTLRYDAMQNGQMRHKAMLGLVLSSDNAGNPVPDLLSTFNITCNDRSSTEFKRCTESGWFYHHGLKLLIYEPQETNFLSALLNVLDVFIINPLSNAFSLLLGLPPSQSGAYGSLQMLSGDSLYDTFYISKFGAGQINATRDLRYAHSGQNQGSYVHSILVDYSSVPAGAGRICDLINRSNIRIDNDPTFLCFVNATTNSAVVFGNNNTLALEHWADLTATLRPKNTMP